jgi:hypothetical protein
VCNLLKKSHMKFTNGYVVRTFLLLGRSKNFCPWCDKFLAAGFGWNLFKISWTDICPKLLWPKWLFIMYYLIQMQWKLFKLKASIQAGLPDWANLSIGWLFTLASFWKLQSSPKFCAPTFRGKTYLTKKLFWHWKFSFMTDPTSGNRKIL